MMFSGLFRIAINTRNSVRVNLVGFLYLHKLVTRVRHDSVGAR
jgi:hypothetical protein